MDRAYEILRESYGENAKFREGQKEAIEAVVNEKRTLVVQKTGWGKSLVYFLATKLLKEKKVTIPCNILLDKFLHDLNTIKSQMNNITQETESLIFIRNLLLPKLLNGEI